MTVKISSKMMTPRCELLRSLCVPLSRPHEQGAAHTCRSLLQLLRGLLCCLGGSQLCMATMILMRTSALWAIGWCGARLALSGGASRWNPQPPACCRHVCHERSLQHAQRLFMRQNCRTTRNRWPLNGTKTYQLVAGIIAVAAKEGNVSTGRPCRRQRRDCGLLANSVDVLLDKPAGQLPLHDKQPHSSVP